MNERIDPINLQIPARIFVERHDDSPNARDVIVEMEGGAIFTSLFVTMEYLKHQMTLTHDLCKHVEDTVPVRFCTLDTPHILVESLERDAIEDTIDNLLAMEIFGSVFTQVTDPDHDTTETSTTNGSGRRATQEVAAVVLSDVLVVEEAG